MNKYTFHFNNCNVVIHAATLAEAEAKLPTEINLGPLINVTIEPGASDESSSS